MRKETIGNCELYLGDCLEILPTLGKVDAVVTDPPYGIDYNPHSRMGGKDKRRPGIKGFVTREDKKIQGDKDVFDPKCIFNLGVPTILWGANFFASSLPNAPAGWLVWDKTRGGTTCGEFIKSHAELAYISTIRRVLMFSHLWDGFRRESEIAERVIHPTQKPIPLMKWCIQQLPDTCQTILDPFMGSGTTGVACAKMGRKFIGIEISEKYFDIARKRIELAYQQPDLLIDAPAAPIQEDMAL